MYIPNITKATKTMSINEINNFILEKYYSKESSHNSMKHLKKRFMAW